MDTKWTAAATMLRFHKEPLDDRQFREQHASKEECCGSFSNAVFRTLFDPVADDIFLNPGQPASCEAPPAAFAMFARDVTTGRPVIGSSAERQ